MKSFLTLAVFAAVAASIELSTEDDREFTKYISDQHKHYQSTDEWKMRKSEFLRNKKLVDESNSKHSAFKLRTNKFSDMTKKEYRKMLGDSDGWDTKRGGNGNGRWKTPDPEPEPEPPVEKTDDEYLAYPEVAACPTTNLYSAELDYRN